MYIVWVSDDKRDEETDDKTKPDIITFYNRNKKALIWSINIIKNTT